MGKLKGIVSDKNSGLRIIRANNKEIQILKEYITKRNDNHEKIQYLMLNRWMDNNEKPR